MRIFVRNLLTIFALIVFSLCALVLVQEISPAKAQAQKVYIDAGHGGSDSGAIGSGYRECDLTSELANMVGASLSKYYPSIPYYINTSGNHYTVRGQDAADRGCDAFVSIHFNSASSSSATGTESYVYATSSKRHANSIALQNAIHDKLVSATSLYNRGKKQADFAVCRAPMASTLLEIAFINNSNDMSIYQLRKQLIADSIARGIAEFYGSALSSDTSGSWVNVNNRWTYQNNGEIFKDKWICTNLAPGSTTPNTYERYYVDTQGYIPNAGTYNLTLNNKQSWFYVTSSGSVLRGFHDTGSGRVYVADNDGRLAEPQGGQMLAADGSGWLITGQYTDGRLERYYIDATDHAAKSALFEVDGKLYFGQGGLGYCYRDITFDWDDRTYYANNDGELKEVTTKWKQENGQWVYYFKGKIVKNEWAVTGYRPGESKPSTLERYYFDENGHVLSAGVYNLEQMGKNSWFYVTDQGYVLRGFHDTGYGRVYVADQDGRLAEPQDGQTLSADGSGWLISGLYTDGRLERYYIDATDHAARSAMFEVDGKLYFGQGGVGYCYRNTKFDWEDKTYLANNDAELNDVTTKWKSENGEWVYYSNGEIVKNGWAVTGYRAGESTESGLERYYFDENGHVLASGVYNLDQMGKSSWFYVTDQGYVLRGFHDTGYGRVYVADQDGRLAQPQGGQTLSADGSGWLVSGLYTNGRLERYYIDATDHAAKSGFFDVDGKTYFGQADLGYCFRNGVLDWDNKTYWVNNDGVCSVYVSNGIMGESTTSVAQMVRRYNQMGKIYPSGVYTKYGAANIDQFCQILLEEANAEGVRAEVVFAQSMHETGWLQFGGDVSAEQCNFAGIGATGGVPGNSFNNHGDNSVRIGLRAQVQHLKAYASTSPLNNECVDPRFNYVKRGCATTVEALGGKWATGSGYGQALNNQINALLSA